MDSAIPSANVCANAGAIMFWPLGQDGRKVNDGGETFRIVCHEVPYLRMQAFVCLKSEVHNIFVNCLSNFRLLSSPNTSSLLLFRCVAVYSHQSPYCPQGANCQCDQQVQM